MIPPLSKNRLKFYRKLQQKKYRNSENLYVISGQRAVTAALSVPDLQVEEFIVSEENISRADKIISQLPANISVHSLRQNDFALLSDEQTPQGFAIIAHKKTLSFDPLTTSENRFIYLGEINDPGNLGTIIRSAAWFGYKTLLLSPDSTDPFSPKCVRASAGFITALNIFEDVDVLQLTDLKKQGVVFYAIDLNSGKSLQQTDFAVRYALLFGSEAHGFNNEIKTLCDQFIHIRKTWIGESLNLSVATGIVLYQASLGVLKH